MLIFIIPIVGLILYFNAADIQKRLKEDLLGKSGARQVAVLRSEPATPVDPQLDAKASAVACGQTLKLEENAFVKLDLMNRFDQLVTDSGISAQDMKAIGDTPDALNNQEFEAYSLGYLTWQKSNDLSRADFDKLVIKAYQSEDLSELSADEQAQLNAYLAKIKQILVKAFEAGRHDAKMSPCPY